MYRKKSEGRYFAITIADCVCIAISMLIAFNLRYGETRKVYDYINGTYFYQVIGVAIFVYVFVKLILGVDKNIYKRGYFMEILFVLRNNVLTFGGITAVLYVLKMSDRYSRMALFYFLIVNCILMYIVRQFLKKYIPIWYQKFADLNLILIITDSEYAPDVLWDLKESRDFGSKYVGIVFADKDNEEEYQGIPVVSKISNVIKYCQTGYMDEVIVATSKTHRKEMKPIMDAISEMGITVHYYISVPELTGAKHKTLKKTRSHYMMTYATRFVSDWEMVVKRAIDIVGGIVGCVFLIIFTIIVGPLIKLESPGPIFFSQKRVGRNGRYFKMYKFRSMYADAEERKKELMKNNEMDGLMFKMEDDPRITKIGKFIRKTSIDEFPQFWNVLKGDMSLVGTRPPTVDEFAKYSPYHKKRLSFRPGITGLWQASGRNDISDFEDVVSLDVEYIDNWSVFLDIKILFMTVFAMFTGK